jgi:adenylate cyclase
VQLPGSDAYLSLESAQGEQRFPLASAKSWSIGRSYGCAVLLDSRAVSRIHALIQRVETGEFCLVDLGSRNGSLLNGRRVSIPAALRDGDRLSFGDQELVFRWPSQGAATPAAESSWRDSPTSALFTHSSTSILVVDIRDYTPLARSISEAQLSQTIGTWFLRVGNVAQKWGSWAQKYIGDAVMAVWVHESRSGIPADLLRVLHAAREMHQATGDLHQVFQLPRMLRIGAGLNTGQAVVGNADFTALGDTVNAAFRLESATKALGLDVAMGKATFEALPATPKAERFFERHEVELKGYDAPAVAWASSFTRLGQFLEQHGGRAVPAR